MIIRQWKGEPAEFIPGLCQEARPSSDWPYTQDWIVREIHLDTKDRTLRLIGENLNYAEGDPGRQFYWGHRAGVVLDWRYDLTGAKYIIGRHESRAEAESRHFAEMRAQIDGQDLMI